MKIIYPLRALNESKDRESAQLFHEVMQSDPVMSKMEQYGFSKLVK